MEPEQHYPGLDSFLAALRFEGIPIGPHELGWLQHVFHQAPPLDRQRCKDLLACTLIKHAAHREVFDTLFETWCPPEDTDLVRPWAEQTVRPTAPPPAPPRSPRVLPDALTPTQEPLSQASTPFWTAWRPWLTLFAVLMVTGLIYAIIQYTYVLPVTTPTPRSPDTAATVEPAPRPATGELPTDPAQYYWTWVPTFDPPRPPLIDPAWLAFGLAGLALLAGTLLSWRYRSRIDIPIPEAAPETGPEWLPLLETVESAPELLTPETLRAAVWNVERFVSDDETRRIDVDATTAATARAGGLATLRFARAVYTREVWLWRDEMVQDPIIDRVLRELERSLSRAGLPVRTGTFTDVPTLIRWREGQEFSPLALEGHRQSALVVIVTDGYGMQLAAASALEKGTLLNMLRAFGEWPRLTFVDCSYGAHGLARRVHEYGLRCIAPENMLDFLSNRPVQSVTTYRAHQALLGDLRLWAATTALSPDPVDDASAFALRQRLGLEMSTWRFRDLVQAADPSGERLIWKPSQRAELLNWLVQCSRKDGQVGADSPLARALEYWLERYQDTSQQRQAQQNALVPWMRTPAEQRLRLEVAFLELWRRPAEATRTLYRLRRTLGTEIQQRLARLVDWDRRPRSQGELIAMPWRLADLPPQIQAMLAELGFARSILMLSDTLRMPVPLSLALGVCLGLTAVASGIGIWHSIRPATPDVYPVLPAPFRGVILQDMQRSGIESYRLALGTPRRLRIETVAAQSVINVTWQWERHNNVTSFGHSELWHVGTLPQAIRGCERDWPRRSLVVIQAAPDDVPARQLAIQLLDRGSADAVLLGTDWTAHLQELIQVDAGMTKPDQLLLVLPPGTSIPSLAFQGTYGVVETRELHALATRMKFAGVQKLSEVWPGIGADSPLRLRGGPEQTPDRKTGITFVKACGGTFTMGSEQGYDDEKPPHAVTLSAFEIGQTEVTTSLERGQGGEGIPMVDVTWNDARAWCNKYSDATYHYALPTEAEWEYAARGGSVTQWSFGDQEEQLDQYAWYYKNSDNRAHPVKQKRPNPLGLYDMHGNVWEWVEDCHEQDAYKGRPALLVDPVVVEGRCQFRVLRGGSAWNAGARDLRSANRNWNLPERRAGSFGFRCVRRPRRQP